jgi:HD-like signal output (HDOD) protein
MSHSSSTSHPDLQKTLAKMQLAALPQSAIRLLELSRDPNCGPAEYAAPIEADPGLAGQILKFVNSSYFSFSRKIPSIKAGIALVGMRTIRNFALWNAVFSLAPNPRCGPFDLKSVWQDSLRRAIFARAVAKAHHLAATEEIFTAALLQDMAIPLLAKEFPSVYQQLLSERDQGRRRLSALEQSAFGWTHGQAAAQMVRQWNLPNEFAALIEGHTHGNGADSTPTALGGEIVALSALLPASADPAWVECAVWEENFDRICPDADSSVELLELVDREFAEFAPVLKLATPRKSLVEIHQEALVAS